MYLHTWTNNVIKDTKWDGNTFPPILFIIIFNLTTIFIYQVHLLWFQFIFTEFAQPC